MKRNILLLCVCLALVLGFAAVTSSAEKPGWVEAYEQVLAEREQQAQQEADGFVTPELSYLVYDIDKDGTPELLVKTGTCEADFHGGLYSYRNGRAVQLGEELGLGHSSFYSDPGENGIILMWGHMGYAWAVRISLNDGYVEELLYEDDLNARLQADADADYVYPGDVVPGSVYLTLCRGGITLPLTRYEEITRCLEGALPAATGAAYPKGDAAFFDKLIAENGEVYAVTADGFTLSPGKLGFQALLQQGAAAEWMQGDLSVLSAVPADLNGDGQLECVLAVSDGMNEMRIILSEQKGTVYAYLLNYTDGYEVAVDGCLFRSASYGSYRWRLIFDAEQAFLLSLPTD